MIGNGPPIESYYDLIAQGRLPGKLAITSLGERASIANVIEGVDIWEGPTDIAPRPAFAGEQLSFISTSANDTFGGIGVVRVMIHYIDSSGLAQTLFENTNGTTEVDLSVNNVRYVNDFHAVDGDDDSVAKGDITIYRKGTPARVYDIIKTGNNKSLTSHFMVPIDKTFFISSYTCSEANSKIVAFRLRATCSPGGTFLTGGFLFKRTFRMKENSPPEIIDPPIRVCGGAISKVSAWVGIAGGNGSATYGGYLI